MAIQLYHGDGKGKTTAAMGLAARALGHGRRVVIVQFLKRGDSGEVVTLKRLGATFFFGKAGDSFRVADMTKSEKDENRQICDINIQSALESAADVLILDELCAALEHGLIDENLAKQAVLMGLGCTEVIVTGRRPQQWIIDAADYITEMNCERHIHDRGVAAREGIEY